MNGKGRSATKGFIVFSYTWSVSVFTAYKISQSPEEDFQDTLGKVAVYASLASTLVDIPDEVDASQEIKDFINVQKQEFASLRSEMKEAKSKVQRIVSGDTKMRAAIAQASRSSAPPSSSSFLKPPRLQIP